MFKKNKKGASVGLVGGLVGGVVGVVFMFITAFLTLGAINNSGILTTSSAEKNITDAMIQNLSAGAGKVSVALPTIFGIIVVVIILTYVGYLIITSRRSGMTQQSL